MTRDEQIVEKAKEALELFDDFGFQCFMVNEVRGFPISNMIIKNRDSLIEIIELIENDRS